MRSASDDCVEEASSVTDRTPLLAQDCPSRYCSTCYTMKYLEWCNCSRKLAERKLIVDVLAVLFGIAAWIAVNGMFVQLPLLVQTAPEEWNLPSYLSVIVQIGNLGPISYSIMQKTHPNKVKDSTVIYAILFLGCTALLLMSFFYDFTSTAFGGEHSVPLFVLAFFIALVGCTSSVLFMPYMGNFRELYLISYFIGEGLSGLIPSVVALIQGVGGNPTCINGTDESGNFTIESYTPPPRFNTQVFFLIMCAILTISTLAFFLMNNLEYCVSEKVKPLYVSHQKHRYSNSISDFGEKSSSNSPVDGVDLHERSDSPQISEERPRQNSFRSAVQHCPSSYHSIYLLLLAGWVCFLANGVFPSIQSYSCLPYGNVAYHLSVTLASMANPLACFVAFFLPSKSTKVITFLTVLSTAVASYIVTTASMSPKPPLVNKISGEVLVVLAWVIYTGFITYVKVSIASIFRQGSQRSLFWCGAAQQIGSAVGAVFIFLLVNEAKVFQSYYPCA